MGMLYVGLAAVSGAIALVYEVVWTRELALLLGSQIEATATVLAAFFGGLGLGTAWFGRLSDRVAAPLRLYARLEAGAAGFALASIWGLERCRDWVAVAPPIGLAAVSAALLLPAAVLLGGALPALLRAAQASAVGVARTAGRLVAANTAGGVIGVGAAAFALPSIGLRVTVGCATALAACVAAVAWRALPDNRRDTHEPASERAARIEPERIALAAAGLAGAATLAFEVVSGRLAAIVLGSSLWAWALVLALFLAGLALGNALLAARAARAPQPLRELGAIEIAAAVAVGLGTGLIAPAIAQPSVGLSLAGLAKTGFAIFPAALAMGAAFPYWVRLAVSSSEWLGRGFGAVAASNTFGGVLGSLAAPFVLVPQLGLVGAALGCMAVNALLGVGFLLRGLPGVRGWTAAGIGLGLLGVVAVDAASPPEPPPGRQILFVAEGPQATAAVVRTPERRDLYVDGDPEASTFGAARNTERLLAALPWLLHPDPERFLEVGLGAGITLGAAAQLPLTRIECVEIASSVVAASRFFSPDNGDPAAARDPRVRIHHADGRAFLARHPRAYDIVAANTLHPWSVGATGLYSLEYFRRLSDSLRPAGIAVQWLPIQQIASDHVATILRTYYAVFEHGSVWWGDNNLLLVGSAQPLSERLEERFGRLPPDSARALRDFGVGSAGDLRARRIGDANSVRQTLGAVPLLRDDRPLLEARRVVVPGGVFALLRSIARDAVRAGAASGEMQLWLESLEHRAIGEPDRADRVEAVAEGAGLSLARRSRAQRLLGEASEAWSAGRLEEAAARYRQSLELDENANSRFALAAIAAERNDVSAIAMLSELLDRHPDFARGWNLLGVVRLRSGEVAAAAAAFDRALEFDPYLFQALANSGLAALELGRRDVAVQRWAALHAIDPRAASSEARTLSAALAR